MPDSNNNNPDNQSIPEEPLVQRVIDLKTGKDITQEYVSSRLKELEELADKLIYVAVASYRTDPGNKKAIYEQTYWELHEQLGMGSIGPATAAAGPLLEDKKRTLAHNLDIDENDIIDWFKSGL